MKNRLIKLIKEGYQKAGMVSTYEEAIADNLLANGVIVAPVAVGGTVYTLNRGRVKEWEVCFIGLNKLGEIKFLLADKGYMNMLEAWNYDIGTNFFLTREEAEKALAERNKS